MSTNMPLLFFNCTMPEETNRALTDHVSDRLDKTARSNVTPPELWDGRVPSRIVSAVSSLG